MKILMLAQSPNISGPLPKLIPLLIKALQDFGCEVKTSIWGRHAERENYLEKIVGRLRDLLRARRELETRKFDIMIVQTAHDWSTLSRDLPLLLTTRQLCPHIVLQMHGSQSGKMIAEGNVLLKIATRWLLHWVDAIFVLSTEEQSQWRQFYPQGKIYVVDNPFLSLGEAFSMVHEKQMKYSTDAPVLIFVGRLIVEKGVYDLLESMPVILRETKCHLLIAGDGPEKMGLQKKIHDLGLLPHVTLLGYLDDKQVSSVYRRANIFILPSFHAEGFPTVITEAMDAGLPIITTKLRGTADHLQEGVNALFVPPKEPVSMAKAILVLLHDPALRARMGQTNREKVKEFAPDKVGRRYLDVLEQVVSAQ